MFFCFTNPALILGFVPETLEILLLAVGLIFLTSVMRRFLKRSETDANGEIKQATK